MGWKNKMIGGLAGLVLAASPVKADLYDDVMQVAHTINSSSHPVSEIEFKTRIFPVMLKNNLTFDSHGAMDFVRAINGALDNESIVLLYHQTLNDGREATFRLEPSRILERKQLSVDGETYDINLIEPLSGHPVRYFFSDDKIYLDKGFLEREAKRVYRNADTYLSYSPLENPLGATKIDLLRESRRLLAEAYQKNARELTESDFVRQYVGDVDTGILGWITKHEISHRRHNAGSGSIEEELRAFDDATREFSIDERVVRAYALEWLTAPEGTSHYGAAKKYFSREPHSQAP